MFGIIPYTNHNTSEIGESFRDFIRDFFSDDFFAPTTFINENKINEFGTDIRETDNEYLVCQKLPGVKKEDISLEYTDNNLIIKARKQENYEDSKENFFAKSTSYNEFSRSFYLDNVDRDKIRARFENGALEIIVPKKIKNCNNRSNINIE